MKEMTIHIVDAKKEYYISPDDILFSKADGNYSDIYLVQNTIYSAVRIQIGQLWKLIEEVKPANRHSLARIGRSYIINLNYLQFADPKNRTITLHTDKDIVLEAVPHAAVKSLLMLLSKEKREEVLRKEYVQKKVLTILVEELNSEHLMSDGFEYVDLGLPSGTLWAASNIDKNLDNLSFYAWGATAESDSYDWNNYQLAKVDEDLQNIDNAHDVATIHWGGQWRLPTAEEFRELKKECIINWCMKPKGCLLTGPNGNRLFLPANGYMRGGERNELKGIVGKYWSASGCDSCQAWSLEMKESNSQEKETSFTVRMEECCHGLSIRPVLSAPKEEIEKKMKHRMILVDELPLMQNSDSPWWSWEPDEHMDGWDVILPKYLSANPVEALQQLKTLCDEVNPDLLVSIGSSTLLCKQLSGYRRVCMLPKERPSEILTTLRKSGKFHDGAEITDDLIQLYQEMENHSEAMRKDEECWAVSMNPDSKDKEEFSSWNIVPFPKLSNPERWRVTFLYPLIREIFDGSPLR